MNRARTRRERQRISRQRLCCIIAAVSLGGILVKCSQPKPFIATHYVIHEVRAGDTLWSVARDTYGDTVDIRDMIDQISYINGIEGGRIYPGQALSLPMSE